jgi:type IV pilus assembly protein PilB
LNIADLMISEKAIALSDLESLPVAIQKNAESLIEKLGQAGKLNAMQQSRYKAIAYDFPVKTDEEMGQITPHQLDGITREFMLHHTACPVELGRGQVTWAAADLPNKKLMSEIVLRNRKNKHQFIWASAKAIEAAVERMSSREGHSLKFLVENTYAQISSGNDDAVIPLVDEIIRAAFKQGASDLHIEILNRRPVVMMRIDNELEELVALPIEVYERVIGRIKHMAGVRAENYKKILYGRMTFELSSRQNIDLRYTSIPISLENTAKIALRFLKSFEGSLGEGFGYSTDTIEKIDRLMSFEEGCVLFAGPTGSGKSTAVRLVIRRGQRPGQNVVSFEDQIEERMNNVIQTEGDPISGLTLESYIAGGALRGDPDIVFIGEVRTPEDTRRCIDAGNLGHLVLTTMHANDSFMTLDRLLQRGVPAEQIFSNVRGIIAQRLARRLCPHCKQAHTLDHDTATALSSLRNVEFKPGSVVYKRNVNGCAHCHHRGYLDRIAFAEVLELHRPEIRQNVWTGTRLRPDWIDVIRQQALALGMQDMLFNGLLHVRAGITSLEEIRKFFNAELEHIQA